MKTKGLWVLLGGLLLLSAAFLLLRFHIAVSNTQVVQSILTTELAGNYPARPQQDDPISLVLLGEGSLARALQTALLRELGSVGMGQIQLEQERNARYPNPVLVVDVDEPRLLWTPFFATSHLSVHAGYATDGDTTFLQTLDKTEPYIPNADPSVANLYTDYDVNDRSFGLISLPGYHQYLAEYLAREIVQALKNLYNIQDPTGGNVPLSVPPV